MKILFTAALCVALLITTCNLYALEYQIFDLGPVSTFGGAAWGVNDNGQVVGFGETSAFTWNETDGKTDLPDNGDSRAYSINSNSQIVGIVDGKASRWDEYNQLTIFATINDGQGSKANAINDNGQTVGYSVVGFPNMPNIGIYHAGLWESDGTLVDLGTLGGARAEAGGINNNGQVVGYSTIDSSNNHKPFIWDSTNGMRALDTLGSTLKTAVNINDNGQIVGRSLNDRAAIWDSTNGLVDLGTLGGQKSWGTAINENGTAVGTSETVDNGDHAFLFDGGQMIDLNGFLPESTSWDYLVSAYDISNNGQIVGYGFIGYQRHAFALMPIPEPTTLALLSIGGLMLRKKRKFG